MNKKIIYLTGFMASGKSTIGPILANTLGWNFYDLDKLIEEAAGKSVRKIFEENGEDYFREFETEMLKKNSELKNYIIALGGGTVKKLINLFIINCRRNLINIKI